MSALRWDLVLPIFAAAVLGASFSVDLGSALALGCAATLIGAVGMVAPLALVPVLLVWLAVVMLTGYVGLGTMLGAASVPVYFALQDPSVLPHVVFGLVMALFIVYTHRSNIVRMRAGNENRARRLWLLRPR